ncbi:UNVERIFIED_CONTAM: hypothetical protein FKN15_064259 [Acipenser sinensis]
MEGWRDGCRDLENLLGGLEDQGWCLACEVYGHTVAICPFQGEEEEEPAQERKVGRSRKRRRKGKLQQQQQQPQQQQEEVGNDGWKTGGARAASAQTGGARAASTQTGGPRASSAQTGGARAASAQTGGARAASAQTGGPRASSAQTGGARAASAQTGGARASSAQTGGARADCIVSEDAYPREMAAHSPHDSVSSSSASHFPHPEQMEKLCAAFSHQGAVLSELLHECSVPPAQAVPLESQRATSADWQQDNALSIAASEEVGEQELPFLSEESDRNRSFRSCLRSQTASPLRLSSSCQQSLCH